METIEQKKRRLYGKQYLPIYLTELRKILRIDVAASSLLSIIETDKLRGRNQAKELKYSTKIRFTDKAALKNIIVDEVSGLHNPYYVFTAWASDCGTVLLGSLCDFNFDFAFHDVPAGIITLARADLGEKVVLDFEEETGIAYLTIEIYTS